ncbi:hypothetical protein L6164_034831 [Bauhinia variegata]|uniref:Uncharacterized protein n=1 Tax=Bauhinia variegata TaxID=167791 RepID=A0ACB9KVS1_BAUVA|nr:hypothetical protein L6164_034831 [Bauhinia variegata]
MQLHRRDKKLLSMSKQRLQGKMAIVTGGVSGIGAETVRLVSANGAFVVAADSQDELGHQLVTLIGSDKVSYRHCDLRGEKQVQETVSFALEKYWRLDIMFSNAGIMPIGSHSGILDLDLNGFDNTMAVNVRGIAATIKHVAVKSCIPSDRLDDMRLSTTMLEGKVALITGAASGIGEETVRLFAENGAFVVAADIEYELGHQVAASIGSDRVSYHHCDVRDEKQVEETINYTLEKYGSLDILFSNAGILGSLSGILDLDLNQFDNTLATNVRGVAATVKHAARAMVAKSIRGSIICTASVAACVGGTGPSGYTTSKHALLGLVRSACSELGAYGIRVNCVSPFGVATPLACGPFNLEPHQVEENSSDKANLKGVVLKAKHIAEAALFLASDESLYISGHNLVVDGGFTVVNHSFSAL